MATVKPKVHTKKFLDWVEIKPYLQKKYPKLKLDKIVGLFAEYGDFCNGCFKSVERVGDEDGLYEPEIEELSKALFSEFPDAAEEDEIELYIWW